MSFVVIFFFFVIVTIMINIFIIFVFINISIITFFITNMYCGIFVVRGLCLHRALHRCVLQETAPRPGFVFSALPVLHCGILLSFLGLGFPLLPIHSTSDLGSYSHSLYLRVDL